MLRIVLALVVVASFSCKKETAPPPPKVSPPTLAEAEAFAKEFEASVVPCEPATIERVIDFDTMLARSLAGEKVSARERDGIKRGARSAIGINMCQQLEQGEYKYVRTQTIDGVPRPLFRLVDDGGAFNYHQLELDKRNGKLQVVDIYLFATGENMSVTFRDLMKTLIGEGGNIATTSSMKRMKQLMTEGNYAGARELFAKLPAAVRKTKAAMLMDVELNSESVEDPAYLAAIDRYAKAFPNDPSLDLVLLDGTFLRKKYDDALAILDRLDKRVGGDPFLVALRAGVLGDAGKHDEAIATAKRATEQGPDLETAWWTLLTQQAAAKDYAAAIATIDTLIEKFNAPIEQATLAADERFTGLAASKELAAWSAAHPASVPE